MDRTGRQDDGAGVGHPLTIMMYHSVSDLPGPYTVAELGLFSTIFVPTGFIVTSFAYPYGQLDDSSEASARVLADSGYRLAVTTHWGTRNSPRDLLQLRRISYRDSDGDAAVRRKVEAWYDCITVEERAGSAMRKVSRA